MHRTYGGRAGPRRACRDVTKACGVGLDVRLWLGSIEPIKLKIEVGVPKVQALANLQAKALLPPEWKHPAQNA